jgi:catechol 2,3-dioxygenase-like lactoylglutathione lyase family enzyme
VTVTFNHTIIAAKDRNESARFFRELLELPEAPSWGVFTNIQLDDGVLLQFAEPPVEIQMQHPGEINHEHGGRGVYFKDPAGHGIELITRPYL